MLDCFRTGGANSPETFVTAVAAILAKYPDNVIFEVTNPMSGVPIQITWMPSVKDVYDACEREMSPIYRQQREAKIAAEILAARAEPPRENRPTITELKAKYGENWGLTPPGNVKTLDEKAEESAKAMERERARVRAEYEHLGLVVPSKFALSMTARRLIAEQDELRQAAE